MLADNASNHSAEPFHLDIAVAARSLIVQRDHWQSNMIGSELKYAPFRTLSAKDKQDIAQWKNEQSHLKTIAEERTDKVIQKLPEQERQEVKGDVQDVLAGGHDDLLAVRTNNRPIWSIVVSSPLGQELLSEAQARAQAEKENPGRSGEERSGQMTITQRPKDQVSPRDNANARSRHTQAVEQNIRSKFYSPSIERGQDKDR